MKKMDKWLVFEPGDRRKIKETRVVSVFRGKCTRVKKPVLPKLNPIFVFDFDGKAFECDVSYRPYTASAGLPKIRSYWRIEIQKLADEFNHMSIYEKLAFVRKHSPNPFLRSERLVAVIESGLTAIVKKLEPTNGAYWREE